METETNRVPEYRESLALLHRDLGLIMRTSGHSEKAEYHYRKAGDFFEKLSADSPSFHSYHAGLAECLSSLAQSVDEPNSSELDKRAFEHTVIAVRLDPTQASYRNMLVRQCYHLRSRSRYEKAIILLEDKVADVPSCRYQLSQLFFNLSNLLRRIGDAESSQSARHQATTYWRQIIGPSREFLLTSGNPTNLGPTVNTSSREGGPSISADGLSLFFYSRRPDLVNNPEIYVITRETVDDDWSAPANLGPTVNSRDAALPCISADGLSLYFASRRLGGFGYDDLWVTKRPTTEDNWGTPENLGPTVNSAVSR